MYIYISHSLIYARVAVPVYVSYDVNKQKIIKNSAQILYYLILRVINCF